MMEEKKTYIRAPVADVFRKKSPFGQLLEHMNKVHECVNVLHEGLSEYYIGSYINFSEIAKQVSNLEHEADIIKSNIRNHLPKTIFMPVDKGKFLWALREQDKILDHADNLAKMLDLRHTKIPKDLMKSFIKHNDLVLKTVQKMVEAVENIKDLIETSFVKRERDQTKGYIYDVHKFEREADIIKYEITKGIYKLEKKLDPMDVYHLLKIIDWVDDIADHAENVADWLRSMIAR
jgi:predicted phosphate transport protein (TIGR00153 family)